MLEFSRSKLFRSNLVCLALIFVLQMPLVSPALDSGLMPAAIPVSDGISIQERIVDPALVVFSNAGAISIADKTTPAGTPPNGISSPYPSNITVSGLLGTLSTITVTISGFTADRPRDIDFALVGPNGTALMLMSDAGDLNDAVGVNLTFVNSGSPQVPNGAGSTIISGTYVPTDILNAAVAGNDVFPAPGPAVVNAPAPTGSATLLGSYGGIDPNGTWSLYAIDDSLGGIPASVSGGWSLDITTAGGAAATTTTVSSNINPALTTDSITFTSTTTSGGPPVTAGTVSFTQNSIAIAGCTNVPVNATGNAGCTTTLPEGTRTIQANYNGSAGLAVSSGSMSQVVNSPTVVSGFQFCNLGGISLPDSSAGSPYPSNITVSGLTGVVSTLTVQLNNLSVPRAQEMDFLLVGPGGQAFLIVSDTGNATAIAGVNISLDDAAVLPLPSGTLTSGTFRPTDIAGGPADVFPAPAPGSFSRPAPAGSSTFSSVFIGANPNGNWALYTLDDGLGGGASTIGNWCVTLDIVPTAAAATVSGKVIGLDGRGVAKAIVSLTNAEGQTISARTNTFGNYRFADVQAGTGYVVSVTVKGRRFATTFIEVSDNISNLDLREESP